jgi:hypothetical protein
MDLINLHCESQALEIITGKHHEVKTCREMEWVPAHSQLRIR